MWPGAAVLLFAERHGKQEVVMGCDAAGSQGVRPGMTVAQATALLRGPVLLQPHQPEQDAAALQALARWCLRFTPRVMAPQPPHQGRTDAGHRLVLDMTGCDRLYRGPHRMVDAVVHGLSRLGLSVRAALAPTRAGAEALARADRSAACLTGTIEELHQRLDALRVDALGLEPAEVDGLNEVGIERVDQLRAVPRDEVIARFGPGVLRRLDLARGEVACQDINPLRRWEPPAVAVRFAGPTTQFEAVQEATQRLCVQLADRLQHRLRAAGSLTLEVERLGEGLRAQWVSQAVTLSRPSRDGRHLWALLRPHVERLHLGHGVEALTLTARQAPRAGLTQLGPAEAQVESQQLAAAEAQLVDVLSARLGAHRVTRPTPVPTHVPEAAVRWVPAVEMPSPGERIDPSDPAWCGEEALEGSVTSGGRPSWLLDPVEPAQVLLLHPEGPVLSLDWRGHTRKLITSVGPERIAPRWWKSHARRVEDPARASRVPRGNGPPRPPQPRPRHRQVGAPAVGAGHDEATEPDEPLPPLWSDLAARDYYRVQEESGLWLWVFRRLDTGRWFVHGLWL